MVATIKAAASYFAIVFVIAFALGTIRVLLVAPRFGAVAAVSLEVPLLLAVSWVTASWSIATFRVPSAARDRFTMGFVAFGMLMAAEFGLSIALFDRPASACFASYATLAGAAGLLAQIAFALVPYFRTRFD